MDILWVDPGDNTVAEVTGATLKERIQMSDSFRKRSCNQKTTFVYVCANQAADKRGPDKRTGRVLTC